MIPRQPQGFTLVEVLLSVVILSLIMVSVGAAVQVSLDSYERNDMVASSTHLGRTVLDRIVRESRTAAAFDMNLCDASSLAIYLPDLSDGGEVQKVRYFVGTDGTLRMELYLDETLSKTFDLIGPDDGLTVQSFDVTTTQGTDVKGNTCIKSVNIVLQLQSASSTFRLTGTAFPRRNQLY